jgi:hypothetical protein
MATEATRLLDGPAFDNDVSQRRFSFNRRDDEPNSGTRKSFINSVCLLVRVDKWTKTSRRLVFSVICLILATAGERITYKMAVDRMTPFRVVIIIVIFGISILIYNTICFAKRAFTNDISDEMIEFESRPLILVALMDTVLFSVQTISASGVSPTMTVILLHANTPCIVWGSHYAFPERKYGSIQNIGALIISAAIFISLSRPIVDLILGIKVSYAWSTLLYVISSALQGFVTLYKEKVLADYRRRMDAYYVSAWLFHCQFIIAIIMAPLLYYLQNILSPDPTGFPLSSFWNNMKDGTQCFLGGYDAIDNADSEPYNSEYMNCNNCMWLIAGFVISTVMVLLCIDQVLYFRDQILGRVMAVSVCFAFVTLAAYDYTHAYFAKGLFGTNMGLTDVISFVMLLVGMEIHGRDAEPDIEVITTFFG